ncbi:hypothetical protein EDC14_102213 [Hydrogenispora ethanolica]|uniref:Uncharacterized protein n=1 Tax=Hydrogenispora ethanolica TaxID=1082276 RepID=A0A4R1RBF3_HYDET|nr:UPF0280 family protein [Hydrogenispora ethanolica]TCL62960.1 hypothetical protein EDC14_102213 [Hydrogenispora ethanolica]
MDKDPEYLKKTDVERDYRAYHAGDLIRSRVVIGESDLWILSDQAVEERVKKLLLELRRHLKEYIYHHPLFAKTLVPYPPDSTAYPIVQWMIDVSSRVQVGPMAAVAGAVAGMIAQDLPDISEFIIENGGDIFLRSSKERMIAVYAGNSPFSRRVGLKIAPCPKGLGVCTSAGTVGPSLSLGEADAAVIIAEDVALADAAATATANQIHRTTDLSRVIASVQQIPGLQGALLIKDDRMAAWGEINLVAI